tara:strand:+ start:23 stop:442 length:420 start_codon:yes stop_codon:yes gene_type:complete
MQRKKFADTKAGKFLKKASPKILDVLGEVIPDAGVFKVIKDLIAKDDVLPSKDKETVLELLKMDLVEMQEVTKRWDSDMNSDSWLSKNVRPLTLVFFSVSYVLGWFLEYPLDSITGLLSLIVAAYFGSRGIEKFKAIGK